MKVLERFLLPSDDYSYIDSNGLLQVSQFSLDYGSLVATAEAVALPGGILLAEAGMGKTTYLEMLKDFLENRRSVTLFRLGLYGGDPSGFRSDLEEVLQDSKGSDRMLLLDGVDEVPNLAGVILRVLGPCKDSISIWIASRDCEAIRSIQSEFSELLSYRVAPLQGSDVQDLASNFGADPKAFYEAAEKKGILPICAKPLGCELAIQMFLENRLERVSQLNLWEKGIARLCDETPDSTHQFSSTSEYTLEEIVDCASWIAVCLSLTNNYFIWTGKESYAPQSCLSISDIRAARSSAKLITATLERGVFIPIGDGRVAFAHALYKDFLVALGFTAHIPVEHWIQLTFDRHTDSVYPQRSGASTWLATFNPGYLELLSRTQPELLLGVADVVHSIGPSRLCAALLERADHLSYERRWSSAISSNLHRLNEPGTVNVLKQCLMDKSSTIKRIELAIDIVEKCQISELAPILADRALDLSLSYRERKDAAHAVKRLSDQGSKSRLRAIFELDRADDPEDELRGAALSSCWPDHIALEELISQLLPLQINHLLGTYKLFLTYELPNSFISTIDGSNALTLLTWALPYLETDSSFDELGELSKKIYSYCWRYANIIEVASALAEGYLVTLESFHIPFYTDRIARTDDINVVMNYEAYSLNVDSRLVVLKNILAIPNFSLDKIRLLPGIDFPLFTTDDLPELFSIVLSDPHGSLAAKWVECIKLVLGQLLLNQYSEQIQELHNVRPDLIDSFDEMSANYAKISEGRSELQNTMLSSKEAANIRQAEAQAKVDSLMKHALADPDSDPGEFERINRYLNCSNGYYNKDVVDIQKSPGWDKLEADEREKVLDLAELYLSKALISHDKAGQYQLHVAAALTALRTQRPKVYFGLDEPVWDRCAEELLKSYSDDDSELLAPLLDRLSADYPDIATRSLVEVASQELNRGVLFVLRTWGPRLSDSQASEVLRLLDQGVVPDDLIGQLLLELVSAGKVELVSTYLNDVLHDGWSSNKAPAYNDYRLMAFYLEPSRYIDEVVAILNADPDFGKQWLEHISKQDNRLVGSLVECDVNQVAEVFIWLIKHYPYADEPEYVGAFTPDTRYRMREYKRLLLEHLRGSGRPGSAEAIERISRAYPELNWLHDCILDARSAELLLAAPTFTIEQLHEMSDSAAGKRRLVTSAHDLLVVVLEALGEYSEWLQGDPRAIGDLWDRQVKIRPKYEEDFSDHLKRFLDLRLTTGVVINREVQISRKLFKDDTPGSRTDLWVQAFDETDAALTLCIEVKCNWFSFPAKKGIRDQLVGKYMSGGQATAGILLLGWFHYKGWDPKDSRLKKSTATWPDMETARSELESQADDMRAEKYDVASVVLDCGL